MLPKSTVQVDFFPEERVRVPQNGTLVGELSCFEKVRFQGQLQQARRTRILETLAQRLNECTIRCVE